MPIKNKTIMRCSNVRKKKDGAEKVCSRFLAEVSAKYILIRCPECGAEYILTSPSGDGIVIQRVPEQSVLKSEVGE